MVRIAASVVGALAATAAAVPASLASRDSGCTFPANVTWTVSDFQFNKSIIFSTPAHQIDSGTIQFTLSNPAFPGKAATTCSAYSSRLTDFFYADTIYKCDSGVPEAGLTTTFSYDAPTHVLAVNQSWSCSADSTYYIYRGSKTLHCGLNCTEKSYTNPDWSIGQIYSSNFTACKAPTFALEP